MKTAQEMRDYARSFYSSRYEKMFSNKYNLNKCDFEGIESIITDDIIAAFGGLSISATGKEGIFLDPAMALSEGKLYYSAKAKDAMGFTTSWSDSRKLDDVSGISKRSDGAIIITMMNEARIALLGCQKEYLDAVYKEITSIVENYQKNQSLGDSKNSMSVADEIKKFKELLDLGAISQEEFDMKKKELLGI